MIWLAIMLFMAGQALNMSTAYWVFWGLFIFCKLAFNSPSYLEKRVANKIDEVLDEIKGDN